MRNAQDDLVAPSPPVPTAVAEAPVAGAKRYQPCNPPAEMLRGLMGYAIKAEPLHRHLLAGGPAAERICLDRLLLIHAHIMDLRLAAPRILDLGCASGFMAYALALTCAREVVAVEDGRARDFDYGPDAFLPHLRAALHDTGLRNLVVLDTSIEKAVVDLAGGEAFEVVLCLSVLHHFVTGYGDRGDVGRLADGAFHSLCDDIAALTSRLLFLELDEERLPDPSALVAALAARGGFAPPEVIGWSASAPGTARRLWKLVKHARH